MSCSGHSGDAALNTINTELSHSELRGFSENNGVENNAESASDVNANTNELMGEKGNTGDDNAASGQQDNLFVHDADAGILVQEKTNMDTSVTAAGGEIKEHTKSESVDIIVSQPDESMVTDVPEPVFETQVQKTKKSKKSSGGLPKNTRQVSEGYWLGSLPQADNIDALYARKIKLIITATRTIDELADANARMKDLGITHIILPFGGKFPKPSKFIKTVMKYHPENIYIHCDHGGDRSGAMLAYLLVVRHRWTVQRALLAVLYPGKTDIKGLTQVLNERGYSIEQSDIDKYLGIYSASLNGGGGGLKVRSPDYRKLINTLIDALEKDA